MQHKGHPRIHLWLPVHQEINPLVKLATRTARRIILRSTPASEDVGRGLVGAFKGRMAGRFVPTAVAEKQSSFECVFEGDVYVGEEAHPGAGAGHDTGSEEGAVLGA